MSSWFVCAEGYQLFLPLWYFCTMVDVARNLFSISTFSDLIGDHRLRSRTEVTFLFTLTRVVTF